MELNFDALVVGAGYAGAVCPGAGRAGGKRVLVLERRDHIGGNAYDRLMRRGVLIHQYGPHIFHTNRRGGIPTTCPASPAGGSTSTGWWPTCRPRTAAGCRCRCPST